MTLLKYTVSIRNGWNDIVVNLPVGLTIQERKLHRACLEYTINGGYIYDTNNSVRCKLGTAPDNWAVRASIKRARNSWLKMHRNTLKNNPGLKPKWHDFKMALHQNQLNDSAVTYNVPEDIFDANLPHEEKGITWSVFTTEDSDTRTVGAINNITVSDADEFTCHLLGDHIGSQPQGQSYQYTSVAALTSWVNSRPDLEPITTVSDSELNAMQDDPLNLLFNDGDADNELIENFNNAVDGDGDQEGDVYPAYHLKNPPNQIQEVAAAATTSSNPVAYFTGFKAMLGQVYLRVYATGVSSNSSDLMDIIFDVDPRGRTI